MISHIHGSVLQKGAGYVIISLGGLGYKVFVTPGTLTILKKDASVSLWTHLAVRENAQDLYGFKTQEELTVFELLTSVSGIGPRSALAILSIANVKTLRSAIAENNPTYLTKVSGIGRKTAEKIVLELKDKIEIGADEKSDVLRGDEEALEALQAMGYSMKEARDALKGVPQSIVDGGARLREALRFLGSSV